MKTLIIPEKPSVARDIAAALGGGFTGSDYLERDDIVIASARGHLLGLHCPANQDPGSNILRLPVIPNPFQLQPNEDSVALLRLLHKLIHRPDITTVINACDAGREGELIWRYIIAYTGCQKPLYRMWMQSMTPGAIIDAYDNLQPAEAYQGLCDAAFSRAEADWIIGINATRAIQALFNAKNAPSPNSPQTGKSQKITVGRVQTPTLALTVERELTRLNFIPKPYYQITATLTLPTTPGSQPTRYQATWHNPHHQPNPDLPEHKADRLFDAQQAQQIHRACQGHPVSHTQDDTTDLFTQPPKLFDLTTLQREANKKHGFPASKTLKVAQELYEKHKVLTYPRTDSSALPEDYPSTVLATLDRLAQQTQHPHLSPHATTAGQRLQAATKLDKRIFNNAKISDHFALIPTPKIPNLADLTPDQKTIYDLVARRFIAAFHPDAHHQQTTRITHINGHQFRTSGRILVSPGWQCIYTPDAPTTKKGTNSDGDTSQTNTTPLPPIPPGQLPTVTALTLDTTQTRMPPRYTEDTLLAAMETAGSDIDDDELREAMKARGLGTPATRAAHIEHLIDPKLAYLTRDKRELAPTQKAIDLYRFLHQNNLALLTSAKTTGEWEQALLKMESRQVSRPQFMRGIHDLAHHIIQTITQIAATLPGGLDSMTTHSTDIPCPKCNTPLTTDARAYTCTCGFKLWKSISGILLTEEQCRTLLTAHQLPPLILKSSRTNKPFTAALQLDPDTGKVQFQFATDDSQPKPAKPSEAGQGRAPTLTPTTTTQPPTCPACGSPMRPRQKGTSAFWGCTNYPTCKKTLPAG